VDRWPGRRKRASQERRKEQVANSYRGEVELRAGENTYTIRIGMNEIAAMENALGVRGMQELGARLKLVSILDYRVITRIALSKKHPKLTDTQVGDIIDELGLKPVSDALGECFTIATQGPGEASSPPAEGAPPNG
jgi:hypothetical protein